MSGHDSINTVSCQDKLADPRTRTAVVAGALLWGANLVQLVPVCYEVHSLSMDHSTWVGLYTIYTTDTPLWCDELCLLGFALALSTGFVVSTFHSFKPKLPCLLLSESIEFY